MKEGWFGDEYVILFDESELGEKQRAYQIDALLPGYQLLGLVGWDDFIVKEIETQKTYKVPTVPLASEHKLEWAVDLDARNFDSDDRFRGEIKWYVKPIIFGGDPGSEDNLVWISHEDHVQAVNYWNQLYSKMHFGT
jgi:hypothetical protein